MTADENDGVIRAWRRFSDEYPGFAKEVHAHQVNEPVTSASVWL